MQNLRAANPWDNFERSVKPLHMTKPQMSETYAKLMHERNARARSPARPAAPARSPIRSVVPARSPIRSVAPARSPIRTAGPLRSASHLRSVSPARRLSLSRSRSSSRSPIRSHLNSWQKFERSHSGMLSQGGMKNMYDDKMMHKSPVRLAARKSPIKAQKSPKRAQRKSPIRRSPAKRAGGAKKAVGRPKKIQNRFNECQHKNKGKLTREQLIAKCA